jgi:hypothetical protein
MHLITKSASDFAKILEAYGPGKVKVFHWVDDGTPVVIAVSNDGGLSFECIGEPGAVGCFGFGIALESGFVGFPTHLGEPVAARPRRSPPSPRPRRNPPATSSRMSNKGWVR